VAEVDAALLAALRAALEDPGRLVRAASRKRSTAGTAEDVKAARRELARLDRREENLIRMRSQGEVPDKVWHGQRSEITALRDAATARLSSLDASLAAAEHAREHARDVAAAVEAMRRRLARASPAEWRPLVEHLFPRQPGSFIRIQPDGRIETSGLLRLGKP
jgi:septal ring factor EnvC (AmiA/AmiB activator)